MPTASNNNGRAFEYATVMELERIIEQYGPVDIVKDSSFEACERAWNAVDSRVKADCISGAKTAAKALFDFEPHLTANEGCAISVLIQPDSAGKAGDVRDILITKNRVGWQIGISMKHNHFAVKHSRIAKGLDFGNSWYGVNCSDAYWKEVKPIFDKLQILHNEQVKWSEISQKDNDVYVPLLNAFIRELKNAYARDNNLPAKLTEYLMGRFDFYKVVSVDSEQCIYIQFYNHNKTLNTKCGRIKPVIKLQQQHLPTEMIDVRFKQGSRTTVSVYLDAGWTLSFRIHSASTYVEPTLKFDIQLEGMPADLLAARRFWER